MTYTFISYFIKNSQVFHHFLLKYLTWIMQSAKLPCDSHNPASATGTNPGNTPEIFEIGSCFTQMVQNLLTYFAHKLKNYSLIL